MTTTITAAFEFDSITVPLDRLLPSRPVKPAEKVSVKYRSLLASIPEVGIVEPLNVHPQKGGKYLITDGHLRVEALREFGVTEATCLVAMSDEAYTYNRHVNLIAPIQRNRMLLKALNAGVQAERIAKALNLSAQTVRQSRHLIDGICPEAVDLLKDKEVAHGTLGLFKKVKAFRQIEMAEVMVAAGTYSVSYARSLVMTTPKEQLVDPESPRKIPGVKPEDLAKVEHEMRVQEKDFRQLDETYNENVMALTIARGYLRPLLENGRIVRYLAQHFREFLNEFQRLVESTTLDT